MRGFLLAVLLCACDSHSDRTEVPVDARGLDAFVDRDAPFSCMPVTPATPPPAPACLSLDAQRLVGATPFGNVDVGLDYFGAGDCITISSATIGWTGACQEHLSLQFSYPVTLDGTGRRVSGSFDTDARFEFRAPAWAPREDVTTIHVDVTQWQEGQDTHDIDITVTVTDPRYAISPWRVHGTFCDWPYLLC